nr:MAG TPA: hypothetical protein [Caudoviricetes sp.]
MFSFSPPNLSFSLHHPNVLNTILLTSTKWFYSGSIIFNKNSYF